MLVAKNITKSYSGLEVLKGVNLSVSEKEIVAIVGASGAGKSTLLHVLGALDKPDSGDVLLRNEKISDLSIKKLAEFRNKSIGFIFQFHNLLPEFTALENVCIPGFIGKNREVDVKRKANELLKILGLENRSHHKPSELSGGEQQRIAVARSLINNPDIVFADEPSGNLDSKNAEDLHQLFFNLRNDLGQTFVIVTHNSELANMSDRKLEIVDGVMNG
ncbi:MAG: ABC transporter ATP-binding protein [Cyclobacteriaceae bacterium]|nr:ABC transporter ATP-binding protein [Cyclobacteriaceae bacterium]